MKKRKIYEIIRMMLALVLVFAMTTTSFAATVPFTQISDEENLAIIEQKIKDAVDACIVDADGNTLELEIVDVEVRQLESPNLSNKSYFYWTQTNQADKAVTYAATVKTKTTTKSYNEFGIDADGSLTMTWEDVLGIENKIIQLTGYWALGAGTFEKGEIFWGDNFTGPLDAPGKPTVGKNFDKSINYTSTSSTGKLRAISIAHIKSPEDGKRYQFSMSVTPTIFS